jgi:N-acetylmuramic acid 6-phosphate etherase
VVLNAGTGMIAYGENGQGRKARAGGWGYLLDQGSAYHLAQEALRAVALAHDGSESSTLLAARILDALGLDDPTAIIDWLYAAGRGVAELVALAPLVLDMAEAGDLAATEVVVRGADALTRAVDAVAHRLDIWGQPFPLVLVGGLFDSSSFYRRVVTQAIQTRVPGAQPMLPLADAAVGAALLALETLGFPLEGATGIEGSTPGTWTSEQRNVLSRDLDLRSTLEVVGLMHLEDARAVSSLRPTLPAIAGAIEAVAARMRQGGRLVYAGAGTSGRLGTLDAAECPPTFSAAPGQVTALIAGGREALTSAVEAAEDDEAAGRRAVAEAGVGALDSLVGISASGRTAYALGALKEARLRGALTVALVCNLPAPMAQVADHVIAPLVGPEVLTGSTRLKAGTAQKLVLNMLSTGVMVLLGKTYGNLMVDLRQQSAKLEQRARRIVSEACDVGEEEAAVALDRSAGDVKAAIVSTLLSCTPAEARERLARTQGRVREALD